MAEIAITVEVDNIDFATEAANCLDLDMESITWRGNVAQVCLVGSTEQYSSIPRILGDFWTEYADILYSANYCAQRER